MTVVGGDDDEVVVVAISIVMTVNSVHVVITGMVWPSILYIRTRFLLEERCEFRYKTIGRQ